MVLSIHVGIISIHIFIGQLFFVLSNTDFFAFNVKKSIELIEETVPQEQLLLVVDGFNVGIATIRLVILSGVNVLQIDVVIYLVYLISNVNLEYGKSIVISDDAS